MAPPEFGGLKPLLGLLYPSAGVDKSIDLILRVPNIQVEIILLGRLSAFEL